MERLARRRRAARPAYEADPSLGACLPALGRLEVRHLAAGLAGVDHEAPHWAVALHLGPFATLHLGIGPMERITRSERAVRCRAGPRGLGARWARRPFHRGLGVYETVGQVVRSAARQLPHLTNAAHLFLTL